MSVQEVYNEFRRNFPDITSIYDQEHILVWGAIDPESSYLWFEGLASALNSEMLNEIDPVK